MTKIDFYRLLLLNVQLMNKRVRRQAWPWGLCCSSCQHYQMNNLSGLLFLWLGWSVAGRLTTVARGGDERSVCVCVFVRLLPNLIMVRWQMSQMTSYIRTFIHVGVSGTIVHVKLLLHTVRTPSTAFDLQSCLIW